MKFRYLIKHPYSQNEEYVSSVPLHAGEIINDGSDQYRIISIEHQRTTNFNNSFELHPIIDILKLNIK